MTAPKIFRKDGQLLVVMVVQIEDENVNPKVMTRTIEQSELHGGKRNKKGKEDREEWLSHKLLIIELNLGEIHKDYGGGKSATRPKPEHPIRFILGTLV